MIHVFGEVLAAACLLYMAIAGTKVVLFLISK
jgi:hypothetical protein